MTSNEVSNLITRRKITNKNAMPMVRFIEGVIAIFSLSLVTAKPIRATDTRNAASKAPLAKFKTTKAVMCF
jgi:hypothetical protein